MQKMPKTLWEETEEQFEARLRDIAQAINKDYDLDDLCREVLECIDKLVEVVGEKIGKRLFSDCHAATSF